MFTNVLLGGVLGGHAKANHVLVVDRGGHHVQFSRRVDFAEQLLVERVGAFQPKTHQTQLQKLTVKTKHERAFVSNFELLERINI